MKKKFLGIICLIYSGIILYVWISGSLKNFLAPNMQIYLKLSVVLFLIMGLILCFNDKVDYKFKISDLVLLLPLVMLLLAQDGKLTMTFASNRATKYNSKTTEKKEDKLEKQEEIEEKHEDELEEKINYDSDIYFDIIDENYNELSNYITYMPNATKYEGKTIRVKGFTLTKAEYLLENQFLL